MPAQCSLTVVCGVCSLLNGRWITWSLCLLFPQPTHSGPLFLAQTSFWSLFFWLLELLFSIVIFCPVHVWTFSNVDVIWMKQLGQKWISFHFHVRKWIAVVLMLQNPGDQSLGPSFGSRVREQDEDWLRLILIWENSINRCLFFQNVFVVTSRFWVCWWSLKPLGSIGLTTLLLSQESGSAPGN